MHSPAGKKRGGAEAANLGGPLVMQVVSHMKKIFVPGTPNIVLKTKGHEPILIKYASPPCFIMT